MSATPCIPISLFDEERSVQTQLNEPVSLMLQTAGLHVQVALVFFKSRMVLD